MGREYAEIEKTTLGTLALSKNGGEGTRTVAEAIEHYAGLADLGIEQAIVNMPDVANDDVWELMPEVIEGLAKLGG